MNTIAHPLRLTMVALILAAMPALAQDAAPAPAPASAWKTQ